MDMNNSNNNAAQTTETPTLSRTITHEYPRQGRTDIFTMPDGSKVAVDVWYGGGRFNTGEPRPLRDGE